MRTRFFLTVLLCCFFVLGLYAQNTDEQSDDFILSNDTAYKIESVEYSIKGLTKAGPLSVKVPIDKNRVFCMLPAGNLF